MRVTGTRIVLAAVLLAAATGCSGSSSPPARDPDAALVKTSADRTVCREVQSIFLRLATVSARWNRDSQPFDAVTARALGPFAHQLRDQAREASTVGFRVVIERNADALGGLTEAMHSRRQQVVDAAVAETRRAYAALPACAHRDGKPRLPAAHASKDSGKNKPGTRPTAAGPVDPVCGRVERIYHALGPVTRTWNNATHPFDAHLSAAFRRTAQQLGAVAPQARSAELRQQLQANAQAFSKLATAMTNHNRHAVRDGVIAMQQTAVTVAGSCTLS